MSQSNNLRTSLLAVLLGSVTALMLVLNGAISNGDLDLGRLAGAQTNDPTQMCAQQNGTWNGTYCLLPGMTGNEQADCLSAGGTWNTSANPPCQGVTTIQPGTGATDPAAPIYGDCRNNAAQSACSGQPGCLWFTPQGSAGFCEGNNYVPPAATVQPAATTGTTGTTGTTAGTTSATTGTTSTTSTTGTAGAAANAAGTTAIIAPATPAVTPAVPTTEAECIKVGLWGKWNPYDLQPSCKLMHAAPTPAEDCKQQGGRYVGNTCYLASTSCTKEKAVCLDKGGKIGPNETEPVLIDQAIGGRCQEVIDTCQFPAAPMIDLVKAAEDCKRAGGVWGSEGYWCQMPGALEPQAECKKLGGIWDITKRPSCEIKGGTQPIFEPKPIVDPDIPDLKKLCPAVEPLPCVAGSRWVPDANAQCPAIQGRCERSGTDASETWKLPPFSPRIGEDGQTEDSWPDEKMPWIDDEGNQDWEKENAARAQEEAKFLAEELAWDVEGLQKEQAWMEQDVQEASRSGDSHWQSRVKHELGIMQSMIADMRALQQDAQKLASASEGDLWKAMERIRVKKEFVWSARDFGSITAELDDIAKWGQDMGFIGEIQSKLDAIRSDYGTLMGKLAALKASVGSADPDEIRQQLHGARGRGGLRQEVDGLRRSIQEVRRTAEQLSRQYEQQHRGGPGGPGGPEDFQKGFAMFKEAREQGLAFLSQYTNYDLRELKDALYFPDPWLEKAVALQEAGDFEHMEKLMRSFPEDKLKMKMMNAVANLADKLARDFVNGKFDSAIPELLAKIQAFASQAGEELPLEVQEIAANIEMAKSAVKEALAELKKQGKTLGDEIRFQLARETRMSVGLGTSEPDMDNFRDGTKRNFEELNIDNRVVTKFADNSAVAKSAELEKLLRTVQDDPEFRKGVEQSLGVYGSFNDSDAIREQLKQQAEMIARLQSQISLLEGELANQREKFQKLTSTVAGLALTPGESKKIQAEFDRLQSDAGSLSEAEKVARIASIEGKVKDAAVTSAQKFYEDGHYVFADTVKVNAKGELRDFSAYNEVMREAKEEGVMTGVAEGSFNPDGYLTEYEAALMAIAQREGGKEALNLSENWQADVAARAKALGLGTLKNKPVTRGRFFQMINKSLELPTQACASDSEAKNADYCTLNELGVISAAKLTEPILRAEAAKVMVGAGNVAEVVSR